MSQEELEDTDRGDIAGAAVSDDSPAVGKNQSADIQSGQAEITPSSLHQHTIKPSSGVSSSQSQSDLPGSRSSSSVSSGSWQRRMQQKQTEQEKNKFLTLATQMMTDRISRKAQDTQRAESDIEKFGEYVKAELLTISDLTTREYCKQNISKVICESKIAMFESAATGRRYKRRKSSTESEDLDASFLSNLDEDSYEVDTVPKLHYTLVIPLTNH